MKRKMSVLLIGVCLVSMPYSYGQGKKLHSFTPKELWLDNNGVHINAHGGGFLFDKGKYYWFGEHKVEGAQGNKAHVGVHCYSSTDLYNWRDEGIVFTVDKEGSGSDIEKGCVLERPKVVYNVKTKKYVMWFHLELKDQGYKSARAGVAVSDNITGPFNFIRSMRPNPGKWPMDIMEADRSPDSNMEDNKEDPLQFLKRDFEKGQMTRDMTIFMDDDNKAYHIYSSEENGTTQIAELTDDYLSYTGKYKRVFLKRYMEAPTLFKRNGKYYFIGSGCTGWKPNAARSAVAASIWGPWKELGNPCRGADSEITFGGQSTYVLKVHNKPDLYIFMADVWRPENAIDGRYIWLPVTFGEDRPLIFWENEWSY
jgi:hypothetical protein